MCMFWFTSLKIIIIFRYLHIDLGVCFIVQVDTTQFIHSVIDSFLGCLQFRAVASNIAVVLGSWYILAQGSCGLYLELELLSQRMMCLFHIIQFSSVQSHPTLCGHMNCSTPGLPVHHLPGSSPCRVQGFPSDEQHRQRKESESSLG